MFLYCFHVQQLFVPVVVIVAFCQCSSSLASDIQKNNEWNVTTTIASTIDATTKEQTIIITTTKPSPSSTTIKTTTETEIEDDDDEKESVLPDLIDLVSKESEIITNLTDSNERNTAKRTINYGNHKFSSPIIVDEEKLFVPNDEYTKKQINVQIIEPHNNGQFLKETLFQSQQNNSVITTITSTTTELPKLPRVRTSTQKTISSKFSAPLHVGGGGRLINNLRKTDENCDDENGGKIGIPSTTAATGTAIVGAAAAINTGRREEIEIHRKTKISKTITVESPQRNLYQSRFTTRKPPCEQPCSTPRPIIPVTSHIRPASIAVTSVRPLPLITTPIPQVIHQPVVVHTQTPVAVERIVNRPVPYPVEKVVKQLVKIPVPVEVEKLVVKEVKVPFDRIVEKHINHAVPVDRPYPVEKVVEKVVQVPYEVQKFIDRPYEVQKVVTQQVQVPVDRIVEKIVDRPVPYERPFAVPVDRVIEKFVDRPVEVEKIVEKQVPFVVEKFIDRPIGVPVPYYVHVQVPIHSPYPVHVPIPVILKPPPPPPKTHFIIKTTKYTKNNGLIDLKNKFNNNFKQIFYKKPNIIHTNTIGLSPPPR